MSSVIADESLRGPELRRLPTPDLIDFRARVQETYDGVTARQLKLDFTRGKPASEQLDLSNGLFGAIGPDDFISEDGGDCRNYFGSPQGLIETRRVFAPMLGAPPEQVLVANNSSLALMHDVIAFALSTGAAPGGAPWGRQPMVFVCPAP